MLIVLHFVMGVLLIISFVGYMQFVRKTLCTTVGVYPCICVFLDCLHRIFRWLGRSALYRKYYRDDTRLVSV